MTHYTNQTGYKTDTTLNDGLEQIFDEIDALILDGMPESLLIPPVHLIKEECCRRFGMDISLEEIMQTFRIYEGTAEYDEEYPGDLYD